MRHPTNALVVDDEPQIRNFVADILKDENWSVTTAASAEEAFDLIEDQRFELVFSDVMLGKADGYEVLRRFSAEQPDARVVLMTGRGSAAGALDATAIGAYDYLVKPFEVADVVNISSRVLEQLKLRAAPRGSASAEDPGYTSDIPLIGKSPAFVDCLKMVGRVAPSTLPVLITGESGTGKEIVASAIHRRSTRASKPFVAVNCGAIPVDLIESELFGHSKGSFTGASAERVGLWEQADGGTIFLDEITETNPLFQVKLLRALQQGEVRRVGSNRTLKVDVRVIAATNRSIEDEVAAGRFRQDLMYRLNAVTISLPPLRDREEDIPLLADHFAKNVDGKPRRSLKFSKAALDLLRKYKWPGNVRELENTILHAVSMADDVVYPEHLPERLSNFNPPERPAATDGIRDVETDGELPTLAEMQASYVHRVLAHTGGNKQAAARILNIDRKTLSRIITRS
ncbi:MAG TPA: sigma-54 dependent transcriptional regulator [Pyrinomonadaceae bacterium]|nr:sigma-54 dependent transcriptional regulator [Pyrinomonadaceae bacterium]